MGEMPQAGRDLNIRIARDVMGWTAWDGTGEPPEVPYFGTWGDRRWLPVWLRHRGGNYSFLFDPSGALHDAFRVMERLALVPQSDGDGFRWLACDLVSVSYAGTITLEPKPGTAFSAPTPMLAVCLAALRSVEGKNG